VSTTNSKLAFIVPFIILLIIKSLFSTGNNTINLTTEIYPPFLLVNKEQGWLWQVVKSAYKTQSIGVDLVYVPWSRAVYLVKQGNKDGLLAAFHTKEREQWALYSDPITQSRTVLFKRKSSNIRYRSLPELKNYTIAVGRGYAVSNEFDNADYLKKIFVRSSFQGLQMLYLGRVDLVAGNDLVDQYHINKTLSRSKKFKNIENELVFIEPALATQIMYIAFSKKVKDYKIKTDIFNRGLKEIRRNGRYNEIIEKFSH